MYNDILEIKTELQKNINENKSKAAKKFANKVDQRVIEYCNSVVSMRKEIDILKELVKEEDENNACYD